MDVIADFAEPLPAIVTAELLGVPAADHEQLKAWSADFAEMLGNFQHNPDRVGRRAAQRRGDDGLLPRRDPRAGAHPRDGLIGALHRRPRSTATG